MAIDLSRKRLFNAELENGSVGVVDLGAGRLANRLTGFEEPQGLAWSSRLDRLYVGSGGDGTLRTFSGESLLPGPVVRLGTDADNVRLIATKSMFTSASELVRWLFSMRNPSIGMATLPSRVTPRVFSSSRRGHSDLSMFRMLIRFWSWTAHRRKSLHTGKWIWVPTTPWRSTRSAAGCWWLSGPQRFLRSFRLRTVIRWAACRRAATLMTSLSMSDERVRT